VEEILSQFYITNTWVSGHLHPRACFDLTVEA
jgi:hypothetical protein